MASRAFEDESGKTWVVTKLGSNLDVSGRRDNGESLQEIAKSCARKLGVSKTKSGMPLEYINEHRRIWNAIWEKGKTDQ